MSDEPTGFAMFELPNACGPACARMLDAMEATLRRCQEQREGRDIHISHCKPVGDSYSCLVEWFCDASS